MPNTHGLGSKNYWHIIRYPHRKAPRKDVAWTTEFGSPYRNGVGIARRLPFSKFGIVIGRWVSHMEQRQTMVDGLLGANFPSADQQRDEVESLIHRLPDERITE